MTAPCLEVASHAGDTGGVTQEQMLYSTETRTWAVESNSHKIKFLTYHVQSVCLGKLYLSKSSVLLVKWE